MWIFHQHLVAAPADLCFRFTLSLEIPHKQSRQLMLSKQNILIQYTAIAYFNKHSNKTIKSVLSKQGYA